MAGTILHGGNQRRVLAVSNMHMRAWTNGPLSRPKPEQFYQCGARTKSGNPCRSPATKKGRFTRNPPKRGQHISVVDRLLGAGYAIRAAILQPPKAQDVLCFRELGYSRRCRLGTACSATATLFRVPALSPTVFFRSRSIIPSQVMEPA